MVNLEELTGKSVLPSLKYVAETLYIEYLYMLDHGVNEVTRVTEWKKNRFKLYSWNEPFTILSYTLEDVKIAMQLADTAKDFREFMKWSVGRNILDALVNGE